MKRDNRRSIIRTNGPNVGRRTVSQQHVDTVVDTRWGLHLAQDGAAQCQREGANVLFVRQCGIEQNYMVILRQSRPECIGTFDCACRAEKGGEDSERAGRYVTSLKCGSA